MPDSIATGLEIPHGLWGRIQRQARLWHRRATTRRQLSRLDDRALADLGISRFEAEEEAARPFYRGL